MLEIIRPIITRPAFTPVNEITLSKAEPAQTVKNSDIDQTAAVLSNIHTSPVISPKYALADAPFISKTAQSDRKPAATGTNVSARPANPLDAISSFLLNGSE